MRWFVSVMFLVGSLSLAMLGQGSPASSKTATTTCTFQDGKQVSIRYEAAPLNKKETELPLDEMWPASGSPMYMFTQTPLTAGGSEIAEGAYSVYVIPEKEKWTLIVNKAVTTGAPYDRQQDLVRMPMETGHVSGSPQPVSVVFGHVAPKQCNMRIYYGNTAAWAEFKQK